MKSSINAGYIIAEMNREKYYKKLAKRKKDFKCKIDEKMQCSKCKYSNICEDNEENKE